MNIQSDVFAVGVQKGKCGLKTFLPVALLSSVMRQWYFEMGYASFHDYKIIEGNLRP